MRQLWLINDMVADKQVAEAVCIVCVCMPDNGKKIKLTLYKQLMG